MDNYAKAVFFAESVYDQGRMIHDRVIVVDLSTGRIEFHGDRQAWRERYPEMAAAPAASAVQFYDYTHANLILKPGDFNAHAHPEQSLYADMVDRNWDLKTWCYSTIYKYSIHLRPEDVYWACRRAFANMLLQGVTTVMVSFYCHNNRGNDFDREVIRAAIDTNIRLIFGRINYDIITEGAPASKVAAQRSYFESPGEAVFLCKQLMQDNPSPLVTIGPAVHSIHASTAQAIINAINLGNSTGTYVQFHLSEDPEDVTLSQKWYGGLRPVEFLHSLAVKGEVERLDCLVLSDCIWISERERQLIKELGMNVVLNPRMNHRMKVGTADLPAFLQGGIKPYLGTDGEASNDDLSIIGERQFLASTWPTVSEETITALGIQPFDTKKGLINALEPGYFADFAFVRNAVDDGANGVTDVFVGGKPVVKNGAFVSFSYEKEVMANFHQAVAELIGREKMFRP